MENIVISMKAKTHYKTTALAFGLCSLPLLIPGIVCYVNILQGNVYSSDVLSVSILALALCYIGIDLIQLCLSNLAKSSKAEGTHITVSESTVSGKINGKDFSFMTSELISTSIQEGSFAVSPDGTPVKFNLNGFQKFVGQASTYLCIVTSDGKTYYIDCLESPELVKNALDALIVKNSKS